MNAFRLFCLAAAACTALWMTGCSSAGASAVESISVRLIDLKPGNPATMTVAYINASVLPIGVSSTTHKLYLNGRLVGEVESERAIGLPAAGTANQDLPLTLTGSLDGLSGPTPYRLETTVIVLAGEDRLRSRTRAEGTVNLP
jgi:LEA14-like dessication related protein